jgi:hypothetical protein
MFFRSVQVLIVFAPVAQADRATDDPLSLVAGMFFRSVQVLIVFAPVAQADRATDS